GVPDGDAARGLRFSTIRNDFCFFEARHVFDWNFNAELEALGCTGIESEYRKFKVMTVLGVDDFASMREVVHRRYKRLKEEDKPMPSLVLIDGGLSQLHAAAD